MKDEETREAVARRQVGGTHYLKMPMQPWDMIEATSTPEEVRGYFRNTAAAYLWRDGKKPPVYADDDIEDIRKAHHTLAEFIRYWDARKGREAHP